MSFTPKSGQDGAYGQVDVGFAFGDCPGSIVFSYAYKNVRIDYFKYNGVKYTAAELNLDDPIKELNLLYFDAKFYLMTGSTKQHIGSKAIDVFTSSYDIGCYGQVSIIADKDTGYHKRLADLRAELSGARFSISLVPRFAAENIEKEKERKRALKKILQEVEQTNDIKEKINLLKKAKNYTENPETINDQIEELEKELIESKEEIAKKDAGNPTLESKSSLTKDGEDSKEIYNTTEPLKEPREYTREEWKNLSQRTKDASISLQIKNMREKWDEEDKKRKEIETNLEYQGQGYMQVAQGNYMAAADSFTKAGDYQGAMAAVATDAITKIFAGFKDARDSKIRQRTNRLKSTIEEIEQETLKLEDLDPKSNPEEFIILNKDLIGKKLKALSQGFDLIRKERRDKKKMYRKQMGDIWLDILFQSQFMCSHKALDSRKKLNLIELLPYELFLANSKPMLLLNQLDNRSYIVESFRDIYEEFIRTSLFDFDPKERLEMYLMFPVSVDAFSESGYNENVVESDFNSLGKLEKQNLFNRKVLEMRQFLSNVNFSDNSDLDDKITFFLMNDLDYHFYDFQQRTFDDVISDSGFKGKGRLINLKKSRGYLDSNIEEDRNKYSKKYTHILDEKFIQRRLDSLKMGVMTLEEIIQGDERFEILNENIADVGTLIIIRDKDAFPSFKKLEFYINNGEIVELSKGTINIFRHTSDKVNIHFLESAQQHTIGSEMSKITFVKVVKDPEDETYSFVNIDYAEGIRISEGLKKISYIY